jgi:import receptor subunit TOM70
LVKEAGVAMDGGKQDEALNLFEKALSIDADAADALLHRANLRMLQANLSEAEKDLKRCVKLRPNHVLAHLRLAAVLTSKNDPSGAQRHLAKAESIEPDSSEVQSYKGEVLFTQNDFSQAKEQFEKAMKLEPKNPTPYVNAALAELNTPPQPGKQIEMAQNACRLLEEAIKVDPQFQAAYVQLGQLKLGMATDLGSARDVIQLYDQGLTYCRTTEEMNDLCSMKLLTQAQVDAATILKMESFTMQ